jgi:hypothetical protein
MYDDIDWMNASTDCGLVALCREMEALATPFQAASVRRRSALRSRARVRRRAVFSATSALNA